jgi:hypothetical protein
MLAIQFRNQTINFAATQLKKEEKRKEKKRKKETKHLSLSLPLGLYRTSSALAGFCGNFSI